MTEAELDEVLTLRWPGLVRWAAAGNGDAWARGFILSIASHAKRRSWFPSPRQAAAMRRILDEADRPARSAAPDLILVDEDDMREGFHTA